MKKFLLPALLCLFTTLFSGTIACSNLFAQVIATAAGTGTGGFSGDGGPATAASLYYPSSAAFDASGNMYISDNYNNRIRKVSTSGIISTIAGTGSAGFSGDGGAATAASLDGLYGIAIDASGNIIFCDVFNNRIRRIDASGIITTIAGNGSTTFGGDGGAATAAGLNQPAGVLFDGSGNLYISDCNHFRLRKVNTSGIITTVAGNGTSGFSGDGGPATAAKVTNILQIAIDGSGNIYFVDKYNSRVRKINSSGIISTIAGNGTHAYSGDGGSAVAASLYYPQGIVLDGGGNIYVGDYDNRRIRKINASGIINTFAGTGSYGSGGDGGAATAASFMYPAYVSIDGAGSIYVADPNSNRIRKIAACFIPTHSTISGPRTVCGGSTISLTASSSGGTWSASVSGPATISGTGVVTGVSAGTFLVSYTIANSCGTAVDTLTITVNPAPDAGSISGPAAVCVGAAITLSTTGIGGTWHSSSASIASISSAGVVTSIAPGTAVISYSVTNSCGTAVDTQAISVIPMPVAGTMSGSSSVCAGSADTLSTSGTGGTWSSGSGAVASISAGGIVTGIVAGTALISYSVTNSCGTAVDTQTITVNPLPVAGTISGASVLCTGTTTILTTTGTGGAWSSGTTSIAAVSSTGVVTGAAVGAVVISYSVTNGCGTAIDTQSITINPLPDAGAISGVPTLCVGLYDTLTTTGSAGGVWYTSNPTVATVAGGIVQVLSAGTVIISYSMTNSCGSDTSTYSLTIIAAPDPGVISGPGSVCETNTIVLTASVTGGTWASSSSAIATVSSTGTVTGMFAGSAVISYTAGNTCGTASATHPVIVKYIGLCPTGIINDNTEIAASIFPNPNTGVFTVSIPDNVTEATISIYDVYGKVVAERNIQNGKGSPQQFNLSNLPKGNYLVKIVATNAVYVAKVILWD